MAYLGVPQSKLENLTTNVQIVNLGANFDGTTVTFNLQDSRGDAVFAVHERALLVILGGITQKPGVDYTTSGSTITFTTAPVSNLTIHIRKMYGVQRIIGVNDGVISPIKLSTGGPVWNSSGNVTISGDLNVTGSFNAGTNGLFWEDNERAKFGADNDLEIYHTGSDSFIRDSGTGNLYIEGTDLTLRASSAAEMRYLEANESNGDVSLFFGNNKKFETTAQGISVTGDINGTGNFKITSTNTGSTASPEIDIFRDSASPADGDYLGQIKFTGKQDGGGTVNYAKISGKILDASNGTEDGILEFMLRKAGSNNIAARFRSDSFQLLNGTSLTVNGNISTDANINLDDSTGANVGRLNIGTSDDLVLYHNATNSYIENTTGDLYLQCTGSGDDIIVQSTDDIFLNPQGGNNGVNILGGGRVELYYNNSEKFRTQNTGVQVFGSLAVSQEYPTIRPTLDLNFAATKTLDSRITFTRNGVGTYVGEDGLIKYASNNVPRFDHDPITRESLGLMIEESRTNLWENSSDLTISDAPVYGNWNAASRTGNVAVSPDGLTEGDRSTFSTASSSVVERFSATAGTVYTFSIYLKKDPTSVDTLLDYFGFLVCWSNNGSTLTSYAFPDLVSGQNASDVLTDEWKRFSVSYTCPANATSMEFGISNRGSGPATLSQAYSVLCWGAQIEAGSYATSLIPTNGSAVTRGQDIAKITGTNFTNFYNQTEGTLVAHYYSTVDDNYIAQLENSATPGDDRIGLVNYSAYQGFVETGNSTQASLDNGTPTVGGVNKVAFAFKTNDFAVSLNSATPVTDTSGTMPTVGRMMIGSRHGGAYDVLKSTIRHLSYYPKRLPNAQLQGLTQQ